MVSREERKMIKQCVKFLIEENAWGSWHTIYKEIERESLHTHETEAKP